MRRFIPIAGIGLLLAGSGLRAALQTENAPADSSCQAAPAVAKSTPQAVKAIPPAGDIVAADGSFPKRQHRGGPPPPRSQDRTPDPRRGPFNRSGQFPPRDMPPQAGGRPPMWRGGPLPPFLFMLAEKRPDEQERILMVSPRFREMSPVAQQEVREKLKHINAMNPQQRQQLRERFAIFHHLPPEARERIRTEIFPAWNRLPDQRRDAMMREFRILRPMRPAEREQRFVQDTFVKQFSTEEQQLLRQLISLSLSSP